MTTSIAPAVGMVPDLPWVYHQIDGSAFAQNNCVPSTATMLMDRCSVGRWRVGAPALRILSGDTSGGMSYSQIAPAIATATKGEVTATVLSTDAAGMKALVAAGHPVGVSIDCSVTINTPYHTGGYAGSHSIYVNAFRYNAALARDEYLVGDPGRGTVSNDLEYVWWPAWLLHKAALSNGGGRIWLLVGRDTEGSAIKSVGSAVLRSKPSLTSTSKGTFAAGLAFTGLGTTVGGPWTIGTRTASGWTRVSRRKADGTIVTGYLPGRITRAA